VVGWLVGLWLVGVQAMDPELSLIMANMGQASALNYLPFMLTIVKDRASTAGNPS
jgi:hypothetical protein